MSAVLGRVRDAFVRPAVVGGTSRVERVADRAVPATVGVLSAPGAARTAGAVVGLALACRARRPCAVVCVWTGDADAGPGESGLAVSAARRLAARLDGRWIAARGRGRIVWVSLPGDPVEAAATAQRVAASAGDAAVVTVVGGPRPEAFDRFLAEQDRLLVVRPDGAPDGVEELAVAEAARLGRGAAALTLGAGLGARVAAASGFAVGLAAARAAATAALEGTHA